MEVQHSSQQDRRASSRVGGRVGAEPASCELGAGAGSVDLFELAPH